jgi:hypothetical protein
MRGNARASMILSVFEAEYEAMYLMARSCLGQKEAHEACLSVFEHLVDHFLRNSETVPPSRHCLTQVAQTHLETLLRRTPTHSHTLMQNPVKR